MKRVFLTALSVISLIFILFSSIIKGNSTHTLKDTTNLSSMEYYNLYHEKGLSLTYDEYIMACSLVQGETAGAELHWSELVAGIIYNRVNSKDFPNTVYEVLSQPNQFDELKYYNSKISINDISYEAVFNVFTNNATQTMKHLDGAVYYCNPDILDSEVVSWFDDNLTKTYDATYSSNGYIYHHVFYR